MTTTMHPDDLELFEYVEGELDNVREPELAEHVRSCPRCAEEVRLLEAAKAALRGSPLLQLPARRREILLAGLPRQRAREPLFASPKRLIAILTPVAAVAAVVTVLVSTDGGGGLGRDAEEAAAPAEVEAAAKAGQDAGAAAEPAQAEDAPREAAAPSLESAAPPVVRVEGPAPDVARFLREAGFDARVAAGGAVEVLGGADPNAVRQALLGKESGDVAVFVR